MAYGRRFLRSSSRFLAYADEASYPVYLLHQTVIVIVGFVVVQWGVGVPVNFAAALFVSLLVTLLVYELAVRRVGATRFLFGMKPLRRKAPAVEAPAESPALGLRERTFATATRPAVVRLPASPDRASWSSTDADAGDRGPAAVRRPALGVHCGLQLRPVCWV